MADTGAPLNIPLLGDGDAFAPFETPINAAAVAVNSAWNGMLTQAYLRYPTKAALNAVPGTAIGQHATVWNDTVTPANNGDYAWSGTQWIQISQASSPPPFAQAAGIIGVAFSATNVSTQAVTFPVGRFTVPPLVMVTIQNVAAGAQKLIAHASGVTTTGFNLTEYTGDLSTTTITAANNQTAWTAIQMTSTTAGG